MTGNKDCLAQAGKTTAVAGGAGLFVSAIQNTMGKHSEGAKGIFTRTGGTIGFLGTALHTKTSLVPFDSKCLLIYYLL